MADFNSQALPFQIRVLEGDLSNVVLQDGQPAGVIQLAGRAAPHRPIKFTTTQRVKTTWYPGNPNATQQAIGPVEEPTTVGGMWKDRYLGDGVSLLLFDTIRDICRRALSVEVSWGMALGGDSSSPSVSGTTIVRVGVITRVDLSPDRVQDVGWSIEFTWRSGGEPAAPIIGASSRLSPREEFTAAAEDLKFTGALWDAFSQSSTIRQVGLPQVVQQRMADAMAAVNVATDGIQNAGAAIAEASSIPLRQARQVAGACEGAVQALRDSIGLVLTIQPLGLEVVDSALGLLKARTLIFDLLGQFTRSQERCTVLGAGVLEHAEPDILAEVRAPAGTDLRDLAIRYYGTPDMWWAIAQFNDIVGSAVPSPPGGPSDQPARPLLIPRPQVAAGFDKVC